MTHFVNGGNPGGGNAYPGVTQTTIAGALSLIRDQMLNGISGEGWQIGDVDDIAGSLTFTIDGTGTTNNKLRIEVSGSPNVKPGHANHFIGFRVRDLDSTGTTTSSEVAWSPLCAIPFEDGNTNKIFLTVEEDSLVACCIPSAGFAASVFVGMVDRLNETDNLAIYIGYPLTYGEVPTSSPSDTEEVRQSGLYRTFVAKRFEDGKEWSRVANNTTPGLDFSANQYANLVNHHDPMDLRWYSSSTWHRDTNGRNIARGTHLGSGNAYSPKPILMPFFIIETGYKADQSYTASSTSQDYTVSRYPGLVQLACRGYVKNVVRGLAYAGAGIQWQTESGELYMSTGGGGWHAMRIA